MKLSDYKTRQELYKEIESDRNSKVILYVTGDRPGMETQISPEVVDLFVDHLDGIWPTERISLILHTNGGNTAAAWRLINLLRTFCDKLEIIVPAKAMSAGTLMCLGANGIIMTKQAILGPIDPSLNGPLNPIVPGTAGQRAPVSVEAIQGYLEVAQNELKITESASLAHIWNGLSEKIHPLVLGQIFRSRQQIRNLAERLLSHQDIDDDKRKSIIDFLCSESGSHDHSINRREAREMGLEIENPSSDFYDILRNTEKSIITELQMREPFSPDTILAGQASATYSVPRGLIESSAGGSHQFISEGTLTDVSTPSPAGPPQIAIQDKRTFEAWRKVV